MNPWLVLLYAVMIIGVAILMEGVAFLMHKYVMHGFLWILHEDHHRPRGGWFQKNDLFTLFFSSIAITFFLLGNITSSFVYTAVGIGVTLYGIGYFLFHDVLFHRRIKWLRFKPRSPYLKRIIKSHARHHQNPNKKNGRSFGFLFASLKSMSGDSNP
jgi:beta-carotene 3-hydroxylase